MPKSSKGTVTLRSVKSRLILRWTWSKELGGNGKRFEMPLGLGDTVSNRKVAELKAKLIERDLANEQFDSTLEKYRSSVERTSIKLEDLFNKFIEYKSNYLENSSLSKYKALLNQIQSFFKQKNASNIGEMEAIAFRDWLKERLESITVKERLTLMSACWDWAKKKYQLSENPWTEVIARFKVPPKQKAKPFSAEEIKAIVQGFRIDPEYAFYSDFVEFILGTGCRTGEACALRWKHVADDCASVWFGESITVDRKRKATKTNESRTVPMSDRLRQMLLTRKPANPNPDDAVFPSRRGKVMNQRNFARRPWIEVLTKLQIDYRRPYNSRHTMASHSIYIHGMNPAQVAKLLGHDPKTLYRNYLGDVGESPQLPDVLS